jgi:hypothetical protein
LTTPYNVQISLFRGAAIVPIACMVMTILLCRHNVFGLGPQSALSGDLHYFLRKG